MNVAHAGNLDLHRHKLVAHLVGRTYAGRKDQVVAIDLYEGKSQEGTIFLGVVVEEPVEVCLLERLVHKDAAVGATDFQVNLVVVVLPARLVNGNGQRLVGIALDGDGVAALAPRYSTGFRGDGGHR